MFSFSIAGDDGTLSFTGSSAVVSCWVRSRLSSDEERGTVNSSVIDCHVLDRK